MGIREIFTSRRIKLEVVPRSEDKGMGDFDVHVYRITRKGRDYLNTVPVRAVPAGSYEALG